MSKSSPIGIFDSGIGGLTVANAIYSLLPQEALCYVADSARVPYGPRTQAQIIDFSKQITRFLLIKGCKIIVVACNTATSAALETLRATWPNVTFVGMEPAVKPAAKATLNSKVGVLATAATFRSERYATLMERYATGVQVWEDPCVGLVPLIEANKLHSPDTRQLLLTVLHPMLEADIDTLVLGCTHYPFIRPLLEELLPPHITIIDPAPAVARQVQRQLEELDLLSAPTTPLPAYTFFATGRLHGHIAQLSPIPWQIQPSLDWWPVANAQPV